MIGNANYPDASTPLSTTVKDARTLADEFKRLDFEVEVSRERRQGGDAARDRCALRPRSATDTEALFYFSGFGLQVGRRSYLIPVNAQVWSENDVSRDGISVDDLLTDMHRKGAKVKIVIIDAARRNPFERRFRASPLGLAPLGAPEGTLALFSAAPGARRERSRRHGCQQHPGHRADQGAAFAEPDRRAGFQSHPHRRRARVQQRDRAVDRIVAARGVLLPRLAHALLPRRLPLRTHSGTCACAAHRRLHQLRHRRPPRRRRAGTSARRSGAARPQPAPAQPRASTARAPSTAPARFEPGQVFRDCADCPEMVVVPAGNFMMGARQEYERPVHRVQIDKPFAIGRYEITFAEWMKCTTDGPCNHRPNDRGWGRDNRPVINISWVDAKAYATWLSQKTGQTYRLPSEAEWEYAARGGTRTPYLVGAGCRLAQRELRRMQHGPGAAHLAGRLVQAQSVRPVRHLRQCRRMGRGLLERQLSRRAGGRLALDHRAVPAARTARRRVRQPGSPTRAPRRASATITTCGTAPTASGSCVSCPDRAGRRLEPPQAYSMGAFGRVNFEARACACPPAEQVRLQRSIRRSGASRPS